MSHKTVGSPKNSYIMNWSMEALHRGMSLNEVQSQQAKLHRMNTDQVREWTKANWPKPPFEEQVKVEEFGEAYQVLDHSSEIPYQVGTYTTKEEAEHERKAYLGAVLIHKAREEFFNQMTELGAKWGLEEYEVREIIMED